MIENLDCDQMGIEDFKAFLCLICKNPPNPAKLTAECINDRKSAQNLSGLNKLALEVQKTLSGAKKSVKGNPCSRGCRDDFLRLKE